MCFVGCAPFSVCVAPWPGADVRYLNMSALTRGRLHSSFWVVDRQHMYIGSANMDWRSLSKVLEDHDHTCSLDTGSMHLDESCPTARLGDIWTPNISPTRVKCGSRPVSVFWGARQPVRLSRSA